MRRHPSHYLSPARANARQGKTPKPAAASPSHHSNAPNKPESQSILSKIVAHWIDGLSPDPERACLLGRPKVAHLTSRTQAEIWQIVNQHTFRRFSQSGAEGPELDRFKRPRLARQR